MNSGHRKQSVAAQVVLVSVALLCLWSPFRRRLIEPLLKLLLSVLKVLRQLAPLLPLCFVALPTALEAPDSVIWSTRGVVALGAVLGALIKRKSEWRSLATLINVVIVVEEIGAFASMWWRSATSLFMRETIVKEAVVTECDVFKFDFGELTIGQVASASSAAAGGAAIQTWVQNVIELARQRIDDSMDGLHCEVSPIIIDQVTTNKVVKNEFLKLLGCKGEPAAETAARWSGAFQDMAVKMKLTDSQGGSTMKNMVFDAV